MLIEKSMNTQISPRFAHEKLENPTFSDLIDIFEDLWNGYIFSKVQLLLNTPHGDVAAMTVLSSYFEAISSYTTGESSDGSSKKFFVQGFCKVFSSDSAEIRSVAAEVYKNIRCGLAHQGMMSHKVHYSRAGAKAFFVTYPKRPDGSLDISAGAASIILNPWRVYDGVEKHFKNYLARLRQSEDKELGQAFRRSVIRLWGLETGENPVGMTEAEFRGDP